mgnify:CR=1 FL=1
MFGLAAREKQEHVRISNVECAEARVTFDHSQVEHFAIEVFGAIYISDAETGFFDAVELGHAITMWPFVRTCQLRV